MRSIPNIYNLHPKNIHIKGYDLRELAKSHSALNKYIKINEHEKETIDFANPDAVFHLNKAILKADYQISDWKVPANYLCPPIPGRADYIYFLNDLIEDETSGKSKIKGLDIGVGANCIYPILGAQIYNWKMFGSDINLASVEAAKANVRLNPALSDKIEIRHQGDASNIFKDIIKPNEYFDFTMCNPPFHASREEAESSNLKKLKNLELSEDIRLNFGGKSNELWCNGGEALFIKRMIKESISFKEQVGWFTCLVSKKENLVKLKKQLTKLKAEFKVIPMNQGQKKSRILAWKYSN